MDTSAIYQKTEKGASEVATRNHRLAARTRSVLILVDGKRSVAQIIAQAMHFGDAERCLAQLASDGFIEPAGGDGKAGEKVRPSPEQPDESPSALIPTAPTAAANPPHHDLPQVESPTASLAAVSAYPIMDRMAAFMTTKTFATRYFIDLLGADSAALTTKIESAKTEGQLLLLMEKCREIVQQLKGRDRAERFWQRVQDTLYGEP